jgi:hypothetical protein
MKHEKHGWVIVDGRGIVRFGRHFSEDGQLAERGCVQLFPTSKMAKRFSWPKEGIAKATLILDEWDNQ